MRLEYRSAPFGDTVLVIDDSDKIVLSYRVVKFVMYEFLDLSVPVQSWEEPGIEPRGLVNQEEFGELLATRIGYTLSSTNVELWDQKVRKFTED